MDMLDPTELTDTTSLSEEPYFVFLYDKHTWPILLKVDAGLDYEPELYDATIDGFIPIMPIDDKWDIAALVPAETSQQGNRVKGKLWQPSLEDDVRKVLEKMGPYFELENVIATDDEGETYQAKVPIWTSNLDLWEEKEFDFEGYIKKMDSESKKY